MENQVCISVHLQANQWRKSFTTYVVSLNSCDLFLSVSMYMQEQQNCSHKTWLIGTKIVPNGNNRINFVSLLRTKRFPFICCFGIVIFRLSVKTVWKMKNGPYFPNYDMLIWTLLLAFFDSSGEIPEFNQLWNIKEGGFKISRLLNSNIPIETPSSLWALFGWAIYELGLFLKLCY